MNSLRQSQLCELYINKVSASVNSLYNKVSASVNSLYNKVSASDTLCLRVSV